MRKPWWVSVAKLSEKTINSERADHIEEPLWGERPEKERNPGTLSGAKCKEKTMRGERSQKWR